MTGPITVLKRNLRGDVTWQYDGILLERARDSVRLEARFNRPDTPFQGTVLRENDRFVETFYTERWYNIFEIHDRDDDHIKGWYCNLAFPAIWESPSVISYVDLALDLWVTGDGGQTVVDQDEFDDLGLDEAMRTRVYGALADLQNFFRNNKQDGG